MNEFLYSCCLSVCLSVYLCAVLAAQVIKQAHQGQRVTRSTYVSVLLHFKVRYTCYLILHAHNVSF